MKRSGQQEPRLSVLVAVAVGLAACASPASGPKPSDPSARPAPAWPVRPPRNTVAYVVGEGESLGEIARCSGIAAEELARDNGIPDPNRIIAGETLYIPARNHCGHESDPAGPARARARTSLARAQRSLDDADFEAALSVADGCTQTLGRYGADAEANGLRARCHLVAGTAATGLDDRERAIREFRAALALDPTIELSSDETSPRVRELMAAARSDATR